MQHNATSDLRRLMKKKTTAWSRTTSVWLTLTGHFHTRSKAHSHDSTKHFQWWLFFSSLQGLTAEVNPATVREGEKVTLKCSTTCTLSNHPTIVWFRDGQSVSKTEFQANSDDSGRYRCADQGQDLLSSAPVSLDVQCELIPDLINMSASYYLTHIGAAI